MKTTENWWHTSEKRLKRHATRTPTHRSSFFGGVQDLWQVKWYVFKAGNERQVHHYSPKTTHYQRGSVAQIHRFSSSFATFSLFTRHYKSWISCVCQHLKIVWESSKSDPANFSRITRHTFELALAPKMKKCDHFGGYSIPSLPWINVGSCADDRIYASAST